MLEMQASIRGTEWPMKKACEPFKYEQNEKKPQKKRMSSGHRG